MKRVLALSVFSVFCLISINALAWEESAHTPAQHRHTKYARMKNPVPMNEQSIKKGKELYEKNCKSCHGESGKGGVGPSLSDATWIHGSSDGEIFQVITSGVNGTAMKGYEKELTKEIRWHLVNYIKSLKKS